MSAVETRSEEALPRSEEAPRAFTFGEFAEGSIHAWLWFLLMSFATGSICVAIAAHDVSAVALNLLLVIVVAPLSFAVMAIGAPVAFLIAYLLRRRPNNRAHTLTFGAYGATLSATATALIVGPGTPLQVLIVAYAIAGAAALPTAWLTWFGRLHREGSPNPASVCASPRADEPGR